MVLLPRLTPSQFCHKNWEREEDNHFTFNFQCARSSVKSSFLLRQRFTPHKLYKGNRPPIVLQLLFMLLHAKDIWCKIHVFQCDACSLATKDFPQCKCIGCRQKLKCKCKQGCTKHLKLGGPDTSRALFP